MKKSDVILMGVLCALGVIGFPEIAKLNMQSLISGMCLGAGASMLAFGLARQKADARQTTSEG